jgi:hypothetical protein
MTAGCFAAEFPTNVPSNSPSNSMSAETLQTQVETRRPESLATAARMGPAAGPVLARLARHDDPEVRAQALICLKASGGTEAAPTALAALADADATVVANALQVLNAHPPTNDAPLLAAYDRYEEPRDQLALIAGRLGTRATVNAWKTRWRSTPSGTAVANALLTAVARMGDADARREFTNRLDLARGHESPPWIDRAAYQENAWVLPPLSRLLTRTERAIELTPDDPSDLRPLRTCDLAANAILRLTGAKLSFPAPRATPYTEKELEDFRRLTTSAGPQR